MRTVHLERMEKLIEEGHLFVMLKGDRHKGEIVPYKVQGGEAFAEVTRITPAGGTAILIVEPVSDDIPCYFEDHVHTEKEIIAIIQGTCRMVIDGVEGPLLGPGDVVTVEPGQMHGTHVYSKNVISLTIVNMEQRKKVREGLNGNG